MEKLRKIWKHSFVRGLGGAPEASEIIYKFSRRIKGNRQNFENFHELLANFYLKRLILRKNRAWLMDY